MHSERTKIRYFTDGAAAQYKSKKNFINLCFHHEDFGLEAVWHFFATSHGKGPCDGVGGTLKRLAAKASLQRPFDDQICTPRELYEWAVGSLCSVKPIWVSKDNINAERENLASRYQHAKGLPGTRGFHAFIPISLAEVKAGVTSSARNKLKYLVNKT